MKKRYLILLTALLLVLAACAPMVFMPSINPFSRISDAGTPSSIACCTSAFTSFAFPA